MKLPREEREEPDPPTAEHVETVYRLLPSVHRIGFLFLDWSGARVAAIDKTVIGDYDEHRQRVRLRAATTKSRRALWIDLHPVLAEAIEATLPPREDRDPDARLFASSGAVQPARSPSPPRVAAPLAGLVVGEDRRIRRAAEP